MLFRMTAVAHDEAARFVFTLAGPHRNYLIKEDLAPILKDLIETFPGLHFLREAEEFHSRYVETVCLFVFLKLPKFLFLISFNSGSSFIFFFV